MATSFVKFQDFVESLGLKEHNLNTDTLKVYLSNATPDVAADADKADLVEITAQNGYPSGGSDVINIWSESGGTGTLSGTNIVFTASGGSFGPFRYAVLYNDTHVTDGLIGYWDYDSSITCSNGDTVTIKFEADILTNA